MRAEFIAPKLAQSAQARALPDELPVGLPSRPVQPPVRARQLPAQRVGADHATQPWQASEISRYPGINQEDVADLMPAGGQLPCNINRQCTRDAPAGQKIRSVGMHPPDQFHVLPGGLLESLWQRVVFRGRIKQLQRRYRLLWPGSR